MNDEKFMRIAIQAANESLKTENKTPFGAAIIKEGKLIVSAHNFVKRDNDPTAHAELTAIRKACSMLDTNDLSDCVLYSTFEPCPMCFSAAWWARIPRVVYGSSIEDIMSSGGRQINVKSSFLNERGGSTVKIIGGTLRDECLELLK